MTFLVDNMSCVHCKNKIEKTLKELGIKKVKVDLESKTVTAILKKHTVEEVKEAILAIGYHFQEL